MDPWYRGCASALDELALPNLLSHEGHEVWVQKHFKSRPLPWKKEVPTLMEEGTLDSFDRVILHPSFSQCMEFLSNPAMQTKGDWRYDGFLKTIPELMKFDGIIEAVFHDQRPYFTGRWTADYSKKIEYQSARENNKIPREVWEGWAEIVSKTKRVYMDPDIRRWEAKWVVEEIMGKYDDIEHKYDLIIDGRSSWDQWGEDRREGVEILLSYLPNSATLGRLNIPGLPNLSNGKTVFYLHEFMKMTGQARFCHMSWEPFHHEVGDYWTARAQLGCASNSMLFTDVIGNIFPFLDYDENPQWDPQWIIDQRRLLVDYSIKEEWSEDFIKPTRK